MIKQAFSKLTAAAAKAWSTWVSIFTWLKANAGPVIGLLVLTNAFGMIAPEKATAIRDTFLAMVGI